MFADTSLQAMKALMEGRRCYLGQQPWLSALRDSASINPINHPDRSEIKVSFDELAIWATNLLKDCTDLYLARRQRPPEEIYRRRLQLLEQANRYRDAVLRWRHRWDDELRTQEVEKPVGSASGLGQGDLQLSISFKVGMIVCCRFLTALGTEQGVALEEQAQQCAQALLDEVDNPRNRIGAVNASIARAAAKASLTTTSEWLAFASDQVKYSSADQFRLIPAVIYFRWTSLTGIQLPEGYNEIE